MAQVARKCPEFHKSMRRIILEGVHFATPRPTSAWKKIRKQVIENPERFFLLSDVLWILYIYIWIYYVIYYFIKARTCKS